MTVYRDCPQCGDVKAFDIEGAYEWDTNAGPDLVVDEQLSCACDLSAETWTELTDTLELDEFYEARDY
jgi:hypothetical protein